MKSLRLKHGLACVILTLTISLQGQEKQDLQVAKQPSAKLQLDYANDLQFRRNGLVKEEDNKKIVDAYMAVERYFPDSPESVKAKYNLATFLILLQKDFAKATELLNEVLAKTDKNDSLYSPCLMYLAQSLVPQDYTAFSKLCETYPEHRIFLTNNYFIGCGRYLSKPGNEQCLENAKKALSEAIFSDATASTEELLTLCHNISMLTHLELTARFMKENGGMRSNVSNKIKLTLFNRGDGLSTSNPDNASEFNLRILAEVDPKVANYYLDRSIYEAYDTTILILKSDTGNGKIGIEGTKALTRLKAMKDLIPKHRFKQLVAQLTTIHGQLKNETSKTLLQETITLYQKEVDTEELRIQKAREEMQRQQAELEKRMRTIEMHRNGQMVTIRTSDTSQTNPEAFIEYLYYLTDAPNRKAFLDSMVRLNDRDGNGLLDYDELLLAKEFRDFALYGARYRKIPWDKKDISVAEKAHNDALTMLTFNYLKANYDENQDGKLSAEELQDGMERENIRQQIARAGIAIQDEAADWDKIDKNDKMTNLEFDKNGDGKIDSQEYVAMLAVAVKHYDADGDGKLSTKELKQFGDDDAALMSAAARFPECRGQGLDAAGKQAFLKMLARVYDPNKDGKVDCPELLDKNSRDNSFEDIRYLYPQIKMPLMERSKPQPLMDEEKIESLEKLLMKNDANKDGRIDANEANMIKWAYIQKIVELKNQEMKDFWRRANEEDLKKYQRQQEVKWLKKYDFNGNGKLDPEERQRAEADAKLGLQAPAME